MERGRKGLEGKVMTREWKVNNHKRKEEDIKILEKKDEARCDAFSPRKRPSIRCSNGKWRQGAANYIIYSNSFAKVDTGKASKERSSIFFRASKFSCTEEGLFGTKISIPTRLGLTEKVFSGVRFSLELGNVLNVKGMRA